MVFSSSSPMSGTGPALKGERGARRPDEPHLEDATNDERQFVSLTYVSLSWRRRRRWVSTTRPHRVPITFSVTPGFG
jgi:hypothetical protein